MGTLAVSKTLYRAAERARISALDRGGWREKAY